MDRNNMRSSYINSGTRSLPHMGSKRHHSGNGHNGARYSPPAQSPQSNDHNDDIIKYIYESWNKVNREVERGGDEAKYYQEVLPPRQLATFRPFNLDEWWARRLVHDLNRNKHRS